MDDLKSRISYQRDIKNGNILCFTESWLNDDMDNVQLAGYTVHRQDRTTDSGDDKAQFDTLRAAKALAMTALDVLLCPELLQRAREEVKEANLKEEWTLRGALEAKHCGGAAQH